MSREDHRWCSARQPLDVKLFVGAIVTAKHTFTACEVAALLSLPEERVRREVEDAIVSTPPLGFEVVVYFGALDAMQLQLGMADRRRLFGAISKALETSEQEVRISEVLTLRLGELVEKLARRVGDFEAWKNRLVSDPDIMGGATCFPGARLTVRQVGEALRRGASREEVLEDHSYLEPGDLAHALVFVKAYPRVGRPPLREYDLR